MLHGAEGGEHVGSSAEFQKESGIGEGMNEINPETKTEVNSGKRRHFGNNRTQSNPVGLCSPGRDGQALALLDLCTTAVAAVMSLENFLESPPFWRVSSPPK